MKGMEIALKYVFVIGLLYASAEDIRCQRVRRVLWWFVGGAGMGVLLIRRECTPGILLDLFCFGAMQFLLFAKMYGKADCHAFLCGGILLASYGGTLREYLLHMLISIGLLGFMQLLRGNVNSKGNLKNPVAFIPYITAGLFVSVLLLRIHLVYDK